MKRTLVCTALGLTAALSSHNLFSRAEAQVAVPPQSSATQAAAQAGRGGEPAGGFSPENTNERNSFPADQFIGSPVNATGHLSHGGLFTRALLSKGNPNVPGPPGAVLEYRTQVATAMLMPKSSTALMSINSQFLFYVVNGQGRLDDGKNYWELHDGVTILLPPDVQRRFVNTSTENLEMIMVEWPANSQARKDILVRDETLMPWCEENVHWNNMSKCMLGPDDGMTGRVLVVMLMPFTMAAPHTHTPGTEEIWTKITPGNAIMLLGSELREMPQFGAYLAPPNGITWHGQLNTSKTQVEKWLYVAGGGNRPPAPSAAPTAPERQARPTNPNLLFRDPAAVDQGTVKGTPLK